MNFSYNFIVDSPLRLQVYDAPTADVFFIFHFQPEYTLFFVCSTYIVNEKKTHATCTS